MRPLNNSIVLSWLMGCVLVGGAALIAGSGKVEADDKGPAQGLTLPLESLDGIEMKSLTGNDGVKARTEVESYRGRRSVRMTLDADGQALAIIKNSDFRDGTIEADLAGLPRKGAPADSRGFVGISFHLQPNRLQYETIYLRMTNGRAEEQVRRNHSVQYTSEPDFPWNRLRKEYPGVYESYVDLDAGAWTRIKIIVSGTKAALYVNGAEQPCLVVNDLKLGDRTGQIGLWVGSDTDAHFSNLQVKPI